MNEGAPIHRALVRIRDCVQPFVKVISVGLPEDSLGYRGLKSPLDRSPKVDVSYSWLQKWGVAFLPQNKT